MVLQIAIFAAIEKMVLHLFCVYNCMLCCATVNEF